MVIMNDPINDFQEFLSQQYLSERTIYEYVRALDRFVLWYKQTYGEPFHPEKLQKKDPHTYVAYMRHTKKLSAPTINKNQAALRKYLEMLQRKGLWSYGINLPDVKAQYMPVAPKWLQPSEVMAILHAIEQEENEFLRARDRCMCYFELYRGIRIGESMNLEINDVVMTPGKQRIIIRSGKGGKYAEVDISDSRKLKGAIQEWIEVRAKAKHASSPYFFISFRSGKVSYRSVMRMIERIRERSHVDFTTHQLRHTFVREYLKISKDPRLTKEAARHSDFNTTLIYTQPSQAEINEFYRGIEERY